MIALTLAEVATAVGGDLVDGADPGARVTGTVEFDSRAVTAGGLFVALPGERVDGHDYADRAMAAGAVAVLAGRRTGVPSVLVADPVTALADLARAVLRRLPAVTVIGITGSSGKTSTKDLLAQLLAGHGPTVAPPESYNNEIGHPWTVLRADEGTRYLVLEKSARGAGHITFLTTVAPPSIGVVLNVGVAHVGEFGGIEATAVAKGELVEALPPDGLAVLNRDDPRTTAMADRTAARVVFTGRHPEAAVRAVDVSLDTDGRAGFELVTDTGSVAVRLAVVGEHHVGNALAAAAVALEVGLDLTAVGAGLTGAVAVSRRRMEVVTRVDGVTVVDDTFNANPDSVRAALRSLDALAGRGDGRRRTWAVLGEMAELGESAPAEHRAVGALAAELGVDHLLAVGPVAADALDGVAQVAGARTGAVAVADADEAAAVLSGSLRPADLVLVKGSKVAHLERLTATLLAQERP